MKRLFAVVAMLGCAVLSAQELGARYLIITNDNFYDAIQPLARWKHKKGLRTKVAKLSETGSTSSAIRSYIQTAYNTWTIRPEFVLLVGAPNYLPFPTAGGEYSDNYYTNMDGDIYNEILSGRLTVHSATEAQTVVNKILLYERYPDTTDALWFRRSVHIANTDGDAYSDSIYFRDVRYAATLMIDQGFVDIDTLSDIYGHNSTTLINSVNGGRAFVLYRGSGVGSWYSPFGVDPDNTANGNKLPIVISATCRTIGTGSTPATEEKWLLTGSPTSPRGGAGYFATTTIVIGQAYLRSAVARGFFDAIFVDGKMTFGEACENGRLDVYAQYQYSGGTEEYYGFTTLGDPAMQIWTATPKPIAVSHDSVIQAASMETVLVSVTQDGAPVESALVCLSLDTLVYESGYTSSGGTASFVVNVPGPGDLDVTVTGRDLYPHEGTIPVIASDVYLQYVSNTVDDALGDNDGIVDPTETIRLWVTIGNIGTATGQDVWAVLQTEDSLVLVSDSIVHYGDVGAGLQAEGQNPFVFTVSAEAAGHDIPFELTLRDANGAIWTAVFSIPTTGSGSGETGPDAYGYYIYDDTDTLSGNAPTYQWLETAPAAGGSGMLIPEITDGDADTVTLTLPFAFKYYGQEYTTIGACSNGFLELGSATYRNGDNVSIPSSGGPRRMLAPFWDDLNPGTMHMGYGDVCQYYDAANHRWVIEFYQVAHYDISGNRETFQVLLLDPAYYPTPTGDGEILYQYQSYSIGTGNTVGIEDHTETRGLQYLYNGTYAGGAITIANGRALRITTIPPALASDPWIHLQEYAVDDSTYGNGNGIVEAGEEILLTLCLANGGDASAASVSGVLRTVSGSATIQDSSCGFGDMSPGATSTNGSDPFQVQIAANPADSVVGFTLHVSGNGGAYENDAYLTLFIGTQFAVDEGSARTAAGELFVRATPNPHAGSVLLDCGPAGGRSGSVLEIYDAAGRLVRSLGVIPSTARLTWDGKDGSGRTAPAGVYFARVHSGVEVRINKIVRLR